jgi:hypothetical protein
MDGIATMAIYDSAVQTVCASWSGINQRIKGCALRYYKKPNLTTEAAEGEEKDLQKARGLPSATRFVRATPGQLPGILVSPCSP